ncbi:MAG: hypothetical protein ACRD6X_11755, partial [Pyrinomonadaceae bacterium]
ASYPPLVPTLFLARTPAFILLNFFSPQYADLTPRIYEISDKRKEIPSLTTNRYAFLQSSNLKPFGINEHSHKSKTTARFLPDNILAKRRLVQSVQ